MDGFVILADFTLKPGMTAGFLEEVGRNAASSVRDEPGCRRFDVITPEDAQDRVVLYEIYDDREAFEAHRGTAHFAAFQRATESLIASRSVGRFDLRENTKR